MHKTASNSKKKNTKATRQNNNKKEKENKRERERKKEERASVLFSCINTVLEILENEFSRHEKIEGFSNPKA